MLDAGALLRTTLYDGDSVSVREALYLGTPVIASDNGMRPAGVKLIPMSDEAALRDAVCELFSTPRTQPAPAGDGQENVRRVVELYQDLLKRPTRGGSEYRRA